MFGLGVPELVIIVILVLIIFGPGRLPELGSGLGEGIKNFRKSYRDSKALDVTPDSSNTTGQSSKAVQSDATVSGPGGTENK
mgnify:CR=1 FL=1